MEKPFIMNIDDTRNEIVKILNESQLHPWIMEKIIADIHKEVANAVIQYAQAEKEQYEAATESEEKTESIE